MITKENLLDVLETLGFSAKNCHSKNRTRASPNPKATSAKKVVVRFL